MVRDSCECGNHVEVSQLDNTITIIRLLRGMRL